MLVGVMRSADRAGKKQSRVRDKGDSGRGVHHFERE